MGAGEAGPARGRVRRAPPRFRRVAVERVRPVGPRLLGVTLAGDELAGFRLDEPAASVRLLLPEPDAALVLPTWNGNEFLLPDGRRPTLRTLTPRRADPESNELDVAIVVHDHGTASSWAVAASPGAAVAVSGPGRGYAPDPDAPAFLLAGDETALPAIAQLLETLPEVPVDVRIEIAATDGRIELPAHPHATVEWFELTSGTAPGTALVDAVVARDPAPGTRVWVAGEAAAVQRIRAHVIGGLGFPRPHTTIRGYWKHGRKGGGEAPAG